MNDDPGADQDKLAKLSDAVHGDIAARIGASDGSMLVKFLALVDCMDENGQRALSSLTSKDMKSWESLGMLEFARQIEQAATVHDNGRSD